MKQRPRRGRSSPRSSPRVRPLPFWLLQAVEIALAVVLVDVAVHLVHPALLLAGAAALALLALTARGPLGVARICGPRAHVALCRVLSVLLFLGVVVAALAAPGLGAGAAGIVAMVVTAAGLFRVATLTRTDGGMLPEGSWPATVVDATATVSDPPPPAAGDPPSPTPTTGPSTAGAETSAARSSSPTTPTTDLLARRAGAATAVGQRALRRHLPAAEAKARRGLRSLGRSVGRMGRDPSAPRHSSPRTTEGEP